MVDTSSQSIWPSLLHAIILGPFFSLLAAPLFGAALLDLIGPDRGLELSGILALALAPVATISAAPLAKLWLRQQSGGYWGAVLSGGIWGSAWSLAAFTALELLEEELVDPLGASTATLLTGFPIGAAYAAVFWVSLNFRSISSADRPQFFMAKC